MIGLKQAVAAEAARWCGEHEHGLRAVVLTGSVARGEATLRRRGPGWAVLGDAELLVVGEEHASRPSSAARELGREIERRLAARGISCPVAVTAVRPQYLRTLPPHIFAYELRTCGEVAWGDTEVLALIPSFAPSEIPLEDAWRLLCNRLVELCEFVPEFLDHPQDLSDRARYHTVKLLLDMATSFLIFAGAYEPTYAGRSARLDALARSGALGSAHPFPLAEFAARVRACSRFKLGLDDDYSSIEGSSVSARVDWEQAIEYARRLWRWELQRLSGASPELDDRRLLQQWMRRQPLELRLRGWMVVLRKRGWGEWWRWRRSIWQASPRYWIYAVASELCFRLPVLRSADDAAGRHTREALRGSLPVLRAAREGSADWGGLAAEVIWNYHEFLVETRA